MKQYESSIQNNNNNNNNNKKNKREVRTKSVERGEREVERILFFYFSLLFS